MPLTSYRFYLSGRPRSVRRRFARINATAVRCGVTVCVKTIRTGRTVAAKCTAQGDPTALLDFVGALGDGSAQAASRREMVRALRRVVAAD